MNSLLLFRDQMRLWRHEGWTLVGIDVVKTSHFATYFIESLAAIGGPSGGPFPVKAFEDPGPDER